MSMINENNYINCEILAPAGSYQCMIAAFNAGADAVYVGGSMFGARAYADNFGKDQLIEAINYAHLRGKKLYLTVNTLLKPDEIKDSLIDYLKPFYEAGLDAVIVQDLGVLQMIRLHFPKLPIHASTQMTVTGVNFAKELKSLGVTRIVTARELSLNEIKAIYDATGLEIESFVHGALCYCYSGQCLLSSIIGGRSGNRGRCAQPCRLNYELYDEKGRVNGRNDKYLLSPKDMCTLNILPEILKSGVYSLKIEGRMKKPEYVAGVVSAYRKYIDTILNKDKYNVSENDIEDLREIYNRGGFTDGFYKRHNGKEMMSLYKPNHYGVKAAEIISISKNIIKIKALKDIDEKDVLEINLHNNTSSGINIKKNIRAGEIVHIKNDIKELKDLNSLYEKGIFRTRNNKLITHIEENIINKAFNVHIVGNAVIKKGMPVTLKAELNISDKDGRETLITAESSGTVPETAESRPADKAAIFKQLNKTGNTDFVFDKITIELDDGLFVPVSLLNELRRECLNNLKKQALSLFARKYDKQAYDDDNDEITEDDTNQIPDGDRVECVVSDLSQLNNVLSRKFVSAIGLELSRFSYDQIDKAIKDINKSGKKAYIALPYICRDRAVKDFINHKDLFINGSYHGLIVRNYEEYVFFAGLFKDNCVSRHFIFDSNIYIFNKETLKYVRNLTDKYGSNNTVFSVPYELNMKEIDSLNPTGFRMEIYGYIPVMVTAGCIKKTTDRCDGNTSDNYYLKDRLNNNMSVITNCRYCYNVILNSVPLYLGNDIKAIRDMGITTYSVRFTTEDNVNTNEVLDRIEKMLKGEKYDSIKNDYTRGHFRRGVM